MSWLDPVRRTLDARERPVAVFFRDDDAGWGDARLSALLDVFARASAPLDVAVIPAELTPSLIGQLARAHPDVRVHQHGYAHVNHEPTGRKCEFGPTRRAAEQCADISRGRVRLVEAFGELLDPVFTPPWNRCTGETGHALVSLGIPILSRDHTAPRLGQAGLMEVPVTVDWFGGRHGVRWSQAELGERLANRLAGAEPTGVMLHHAVTDDGELAAVAELVSVLAAHGAAELTTLLDVASAAEMR